MGILSNIKKFGLRDIFSRQKHKQFTQAKVEEFTGVKIEAEDVEAYVEQYIYRGLTCPECKKAGKCISCECPFPDLARTTSANCGHKDKDKNDDPRWMDMKNSKDWEEYKKILGIRIVSKIEDDE